MGIISAAKDYFESLKALHYGGDDYTLLSRDDRSLKSAPQIFNRGYSGGMYGWGRDVQPYNFAGTRINFAQEVGDLRTSSLIMGAVRWVGDALNDARLMVAEIGEDQKETEVQSHPLPSLISRPNDFYSGQTLWQCFALSWVMAGEVYFLKTRSKASPQLGPVLELWWEPHWTIRPRWPQDGSAFISYYEIWRNGAWYPVAPDDVLVFRNGIDMDTRRGTNAVFSLLREFYTDNQVAQFTALMFKHGLVPPVVASLPAGTSDERAKLFKADFMRKMSGDTGGEPMVTIGETSVEKLGFNYADMGFREMREIPETRFASAVGISVISLQLAAGLQHSAYANVKEYLGHDYRAYIKRLNDRIATELNHQLLGDFGETDGLKCAWDYSQVAVMGADRVTQAAVTTQLYDSGVIMRSEAREREGYTWTPEDEEYKTQPAPDPFGFGGMPNKQSADDDDVVPSKSRKASDTPTPSHLEQSAEWWKENPHLPDEAKEAMDSVKPNGKAS